MDVVGHLVRRGVDATASYHRADGNHDEIPPLAAYTIGATIVLFLVGLFMIQYTHGHLIATLAMVETPTAVVLQRASNDDADLLLEKKDVQQEIVVVKQAPLTSSLRASITHLCAKGGRLARFRGLSIYILYMICFVNLASLLSSFLRVPKGLDAVLASVLLARLGTAWTHVAITDLSVKQWFVRAPQITIWKRVALPTAILAISEQLSLGLPAYLFQAFGLHHTGPQEFFSEMDNKDRQLLVGKIFAVIAVGLFTKLAIVVPASVCLTRIQASLLPEDLETTVPFDRSFGKITPNTACGSSIVDMIDAWRSFDWNSRIRLLNLYVKVIAMQIGLVMLTSIAIVVQLYLIVGADLPRILRSASDGPGNEVNPN